MRQETFELPKRLLDVHIPKSWYSLKSHMKFPRASKNAQLTNLQYWGNSTLTFQQFHLFANVSSTEYLFTFQVFN